MLTAIHGYYSQCARSPDLPHLAKASCRDRTSPPRPRTFLDYRQMFDQMHGRIDAMFVSAPDHHHAPASIRAGVGKKLPWDSPAMKCTNLPDVNRLICREYQKGWTL